MTTKNLWQGFGVGVLLCSSLFASSQSCSFTGNWQTLSPTDQRTCLQSGIQIPDNTVPLRQLHLHELNEDGAGVFSIYTNQQTGYTLFGFQVGLLPSGEARLWQRIDAPITLYTSDAERVRVDPNGLVGVGTTNPITQLHVSGADSRITTDFLSGAGPISASAQNDGLVIADNSGTFSRKITFPGGTNLVLASNGTWIPASGGPPPMDNDWTVTGNFMRAFSDNYDVSIGTSAAPGNNKVTIYTDNRGTALTTVNDGGQNAVWGRINNPLFNGIAVRGDAAILPGGNTFTPTTGILGFGSGSTILNYGVQGFAGINTGTDIGVFGGLFGGNPGATDRAGWFNGDLEYNGNLIAGSDRKLKKGIEPLINAMSVLSQLQPKTYEFKDFSDAGANFPTGQQFGLIAQEVEEVLPELVHQSYLPPQYDTEGNKITEGLEYMSLDYISLIPILVQGIQEQQTNIDALTAEVERLREAVGEPQQIEMELNSAPTIQLNQNDPNPFREQTNIRYSIPQSITNAELVIFDQQGNTVQRKNLPAGSGMVTVVASDLSTGVYWYRIEANGEILATKKMVVTH